MHSSGQLNSVGISRVSSGSLSTMVRTGVTNCLQWLVRSFVFNELANRRLRLFPNQATPALEYALAPDKPDTLSMWSSCDRTVSKPYLFWLLGLAFERKADAPSYCK